MIEAAYVVLSNSTLLIRQWPTAQKTSLH